MKYSLCDVFGIVVYDHTLSIKYHLSEILISGPVSNLTRLVDSIHPSISAWFWTNITIGKVAFIKLQDKVAIVKGLVFDQSGVACKILRDVGELEDFISVIQSIKSIKVCLV